MNTIAMHSLKALRSLCRLALCVIGLCSWTSAQLQAASPEIELGLEYQSFYQQGSRPAAEYTDNLHVDIGVAFDKVFDGGSWLFEVDAYAAWDQHDSQRQRADFRTLALSYYADSYDLKLGVMTEFWGVTESRHLVDILNQTSVADNIDEEVKLGQPMLKWQTHQDWGNLQFFWLPAFRQRLYPGGHGRLSPALEIDHTLDSYASSAKQMHQDFALRFTRTLGRWDLGLAHFSGTGREPLLQPVFDDNGKLVLSPRYEQIQQSSIDLQMTGDGLLLKLEAIRRNGSDQKSFNALVTGFEYTQVGIFGSAMDLGYLAEYLYDQRGQRATTPFENDLFMGLRLAANNIAQTSFLLGIYQDLQTDGQALRLELDTRIKDNLVLSLEGQAFRKQRPSDLLYAFRNDDYLRVNLRFYF